IFIFKITTIFIISIRSSIHPLTHSFTSSFIPSVSQSVSQLASQSVSQSVSQSTGQSVCMPLQVNFSEAFLVHSRKSPSTIPSENQHTQRETTPRGWRSPSISIQAHPKSHKITSRSKER